MIAQPPSSSLHFSQAQIDCLQNDAADGAIESYDFGSGCRVVGRNGWSHEMNDGLVDWSCTIYVAFDDLPDAADSERVSFHAKFNPGGTHLVESYAYDMRSGSEFGCSRSLTLTA